MAVWEILRTGLISKHHLGKTVTKCKYKRILAKLSSCEQSPPDLSFHAMIDANEQRLIYSIKH